MNSISLRGFGCGDEWGEGGPTIIELYVIVMEKIMKSMRKLAGANTNHGFEYADR